MGADVTAIALSFAIAVLVVPGVRVHGWGTFLLATSLFVVVDVGFALVGGVLWVTPLALRLQHKYGDIPPGYFKRHFADQSNARWWSEWIAWRIWGIPLTMLAFFIVALVVSGFEIAGLLALAGAAAVSEIVLQLIEPDRLRGYTRRVTTARFSLCAVLLVLFIGVVKEHSL